MADVSGLPAGGLGAISPHEKLTSGSALPG